MGKAVIVSIAILLLSLLGFGLDDPKLVTDTVTRDEYSAFLTALRSRLRGTEYPQSQTLVLPPASQVSNAQRFVQATLTYGTDSVTLGIDVTNLYLYAYRVSGRSYFFRDAPDVARDYLFPNTERFSLTFNSNYQSLGGRERVPLGIGPLQTAVTTLAHEPDTYNHRRSLLVVIQMVCEAARFRTIEGFIRRSIHSNRYDTISAVGTIMDLENNWDSLSTGVQNAGTDGLMDRVVDITDQSGVVQHIQNVQNALAGLAVMLFICQSKPGSSYYSIIETVSEDQCQPREMTVHLYGRDGQCVDVKDGRDNNGNPVILWTCHDGNNQNWTLRDDGTIVSLGKCMAAYSISAGVYVMIYECDQVERDAHHWRIAMDGTISLIPDPSLVLTATEGAAGTTLTVQKDLRAARQSWQPSVYTVPFNTSIVGFQDLCLTGRSEGQRVWVEECKVRNTEQRWSIYGDGTIRKSQDTNLCVTSDGHSSGDYIILHACSGWADQRWVFRADGAILNPNADMVMDVKNSDPSLLEIILYSFHDNPNQKWLQAF